MTHFFNQIVPRIARRLDRSSDEGAATNGEQEFSVKPVFELKETDDAWGVVVHLPGVAKDGVEITSEEGAIRIVGRRGWRKPDGWTQVHRESVDAPYALTLAHDNAVNVDKIHAELKDGVLRISLPKAEAIKPRKIAIN
jgi:HSP20 family protein